MSVAALPMYDWPEVSAATDRLWDGIRVALGARGIAAPEFLTRGENLEALWTDPDLVLAQTCGLPYVKNLRGHVALVGVPSYAVPGCPPGYYRSAIIVAPDHEGDDLESLRGSRACFSAENSQSGYAALRTVIAPLARNGRFFSRTFSTGGHRVSIQAVADGAADVAAIDAISWNLALAHEPAARRVRVLDYTPVTPGLPLICARGANAADPALVLEAVRTAIASLDKASRRSLMIEGVEPATDSSYDIIAREEMAAIERGYPVLA